jgi:hypothetical protein
MVRIARPLVAAGAVFLVSVASGCLQISTGADAGTESSGATGTTGASATLTGENCATDSTGTVTLCQGISTCPGVTVDPGAFPNCGFLVDGTSVLDVECVCSDSLCPIGVPQTCADVTALLNAQTELGICSQVSEGRCISLIAPTVDASTTSTSTCTSDCQMECSGEPDCLVACGC